jgi:hypothetical protein
MISQALMQFQKINTIDTNGSSVCLRDSCVLCASRPQSLLLMNQIVDMLKSTLDGYIASCHQELVGLRGGIDEMMAKHNLLLADVKGTGRDATAFIATKRVSQDRIDAAESCADSSTVETRIDNEARDKVSSNNKKRKIPGSSESDGDAHCLHSLHAS